MIYNEKTVVWDITKPIFFLPKEVKKIYSKSYRSNFKNFNYWIDKISRDNSLNINWWFCRSASRDERLTNLFRHICILKSIKELDRLNIKIKIITSSIQFGKLIKNHKLKNIKFVFKKFYYFIKYFLKKFNIKFNIYVKFF